jgi:hypothetical protein
MELFRLRKSAKYKGVISLLIIAFVLTLSSCTADKTIPIEIVETGICDTLTPSFAADVLPVIQINCAFGGCHDSGTSSGGYVLETHAQITGSISAVWPAMNHNGAFSPMPKFAAKLSDSTIQVISCWIDQGKLDN